MKIQTGFYLIPHGCVSDAPIALGSSDGDVISTFEQSMVR